MEQLVPARRTCSHRRTAAAARLLRRLRLSGCVRCRVQVVKCASHCDILPEALLCEVLRRLPQPRDVARAGEALSGCPCAHSPAVPERLGARPQLI